MSLMLVGVAVATLWASPAVARPLTPDQQLKLTTPLYHTEATKGQRPLKGSMKDVNDTLDLLVQYGGLDPAARGKAEDYVSFDYLP